MFQFTSFAEFIDMGGYGFYVWLSFGFTLVSMLGLVYFSTKQSASIKRTISERMAREQRIKKSKEVNSLEST